MHISEILNTSFGLKLSAQNLRKNITIDRDSGKRRAFRVYYNNDFKTYYFSSSPIVCNSISIEKHPYGFNGKEKENEHTSGNYDFGARILDTRLGRWLSVDQSFAKYPMLSGYNFCANSVLLYCDPDGNDIFIYPQTAIFIGKPIKFEAGNPCPPDADDYQKEVYASLQGFIDAETDECRKEEIMELATNTDIILDISDEGGIGKSAEYLGSTDCKSGAISWNNRSAMMTADPNLEKSTSKETTRSIYPNDPDAKMTPKENLKHELRHAIRNLVLKKPWKGGAGKDGKVEEGETMRENEKRDGINREQHRGVGFEVDSVDSKTVDKDEKLFGLKKRRNNTYKHEGTGDKVTIEPGKKPWNFGSKKK